MFLWKVRQAVENTVAIQETRKNERKGVPRNMRKLYKERGGKPDDFQNSRGRILKEAVVRVEHLFGQQKEPLSGHTPIVQSLLRLKLDPETGLEDVRPLQRHDAPVRLLKDVVPVELHLKAVGDVRLPDTDHINTGLAKHRCDTLTCVKYYTSN